MNNKLSDNSLGTLVKHFKKTLASLYLEREVQQITALVFSELLGHSRADLVMNSSQRLTESEILKVNAALKRLQKLEPVQYVIGHTYFMDLKIQVSTQVLIPRPETEELVHWIEELNSSKDPVIVDVGTGSGCIALGLKKIIPQSEVFGTDISEEALEIARINARENDLEVNFMQQNALEGTEVNKPIDIVVSNPPYIPLLEKEQMSPLVFDNEPQVALFVDDSDPLLFYRAIADQAMINLKPGGYLFFELHEKNGKHLENLLITSGFEQVETKLDLQDKARMLKAVKPV